MIQSIILFHDYGLFLVTFLKAKHLSAWLTQSIILYFELVVSGKLQVDSSYKVQVVNPMVVNS